MFASHQKKEGIISLTSGAFLGFGALACSMSIILLR